MKNKSKFLIALIVLLNANVPISNVVAWPWSKKYKKMYIDCEASRTWDFVIVSFEESWEGHKQICKLGGSERCYTGDCVPGPSPDENVETE